MDANQILELEKKYQNILNEFINSNIFKKDLYNIEKAIKSSYPKLKNTEAYYKSVMSIPVFPGVQNKSLTLVSKTLRKLISTNL